MYSMIGSTTSHWAELALGEDDDYADVGVLAELGGDISTLLSSFKRKLIEGGTLWRSSSNCWNFILLSSPGEGLPLGSILISDSTVFSFKFWNNSLVWAEALSFAFSWTSVSAKCSLLSL